MDRRGGGGGMRRQGAVLLGGSVSNGLPAGLWITRLDYSYMRRAAAADEWASQCIRHLAVAGG